MDVHPATIVGFENTCYVFLKFMPFSKACTPHFYIYEVQRTVSLTVIKKEPRLRELTPSAAPLIEQDDAITSTLPPSLAPYMDE